MNEIGQVVWALLLMDGHEMNNDFLIFSPKRT
jgi:hypothetical protein